MCKAPHVVGRVYKSRCLATAKAGYSEDSLSEPHAVVLCLAKDFPLALWGKSPDPAAESAGCERQSLSLAPTESDLVCEEAS